LSTKRLLKDSVVYLQNGVCEVFLFTKCACQIHFSRLLVPLQLVNVFFQKVVEISRTFELSSG
jgi:hypothetical protein